MANLYGVGRFGGQGVGSARGVLDLILTGADLWDSGDELALFARTARTFLDAGGPRYIEADAVTDGVRVLERLSVAVGAVSGAQPTPPSA
jgi:hypothetical protein